MNVRVDIEDAVLVVTHDRPDVRNAIDVETSRRLRGHELTLADGLRLEALPARTLAGSRDVTEGIRAFAEHRKPEFEGR